MGLKVSCLREGRWSDQCRVYGSVGGPLSLVSIGGGGVGGLLSCVLEIRRSVKCC